MASNFEDEPSFFLIKGPASWSRFVLTALPAILFSFSCSKMSDHVSFEFTPVAVRNDFGHSQIITNGPQAADGQSALLVVISLLHSDDRPVVGFTPVLEILSGANVISAPCTSSNVHGVSTCVLRAIEAGARRIQVNNVTVSLESTVTFNAPAAAKSQLASLSARSRQSIGSYEFTATIGSSESRIKQSSGSYTFFGSLQGQEFSR